MGKLKVLLVITLVLLLNGYLYGAEEAPVEIIQFAQTNLVEWGKGPIIVAAVKLQNEEGKTLEEIRELDERWISTPGIADFMKPFLENECAQHLSELGKSAPYFVETFVMDNQGALVATTNKTSDYWQGDEAKFIESYKAGKGEIYISPVEFDESTQAYLVQVSVPVTEEDTTIGVITIGIDVDQFVL
ncbi:MAG: hypothetical protein PWP04_1570 [Candidatus Atribacteria bacterium]|nr:hypothetical protein [Candidatus Atribacteria bacterium]